jgi:hypothetical protein
MLKKLWKYFVSASFIGIVIGVVGLYYTLRGSRTHLSMDIASESNVLDVRHPISDLAVLFQGRNIDEEKANLKILTIRVINDGDANIREDDFDSRIPFGLQIDGGRIVRAQVTGSNSRYLMDNLHLRVEEESRIVFDKVIFDKRNFVAIEVLVLHPKNAPPSIKPLGKIAGLGEIAVTNSFQERDQTSFINQVFAGPAAVQISRTIAYALLALLSIVVIGFAIAGLGSMPASWRKRSRRRTAARLPTLELEAAEKKRKVIEAIFIEYGLPGLIRAQNHLKNEEELKKEIKARRRFYGPNAMVPTAAHVHSAAMAMETQIPSSLGPVLEAKLIRLKGDQLEIDQEIEPLINRFLLQLSGEDNNPVEPAGG